MDNIEKYICDLEEYKNQNPDITDLLFIRYIYLDLASKFSFNCEFIPFGNSKKRSEIYTNGVTYSKLNESFNNHLIICNSISKIFEIILKHFGYNISTVETEYDLRKCPHVYNEIRINGKSFKVDLQEDIYRVQMHAFTPNFGLSIYENKRVISRKEIIDMDKKIGYITDCENYTDEYIYLLKEDLSYIDSFVDKVRFVLENIEAFNNKDIKYADRKWHHVRVLEALFNKKEIDFLSNRGKIRFLDCYKNVNGEIKYFNCVAVQENNEIIVFMYNYKENKYVEMNYDNFLNALENVLFIYKNDVKKIDKDLRKRKA